MIMDADLKEAEASLNWAAKACHLAHQSRERGADPSRDLRDAKEQAELALVEINKALSQIPTP
jgi:hypothetical protein